MIKNIKEVIRYSRSIYNRAKSSDLLTEDDLAEFLNTMTDRLRVSNDFKIPESVITNLSKFYAVSNRVCGLTSHMVGVFISQNEICWETKNDKKFCSASKTS